jgi:hydroxyacylglutathione hydrolase
VPHVVTEPPAPLFTPSGVRVDILLAASDNLVWVLSRGGEAWVVDGPSAAELSPWLEAHGCALRGILVTHGHGDHVGIVHDLHRAGALADVAVVAPQSVLTELPAPPTRVVGEGDVVSVLGVDVAVWETPGHYAGHASYRFEDLVFCGDTMFAGGCGRPFHDAGALFHSLGRLATLPGATRVCCAHEYTLDNLRFAAWALPGDPAVGRRLAWVEAERAAGRCCVPSTVEEERSTNPFLRTDEPIPGVTGGPEAVFRALRAAKDRSAHRGEPSPRR